MRLVTFTNLYPGPDAPRHGIFVEERLRQLTARAEVTARVVALRPGHGARTGARARAPGHFRSHRGIEVEYLPVPSLPLVTNWIDPWLWAGAAEERVRSLVLGDAADTLIDAHFLYPDGAAAVLLGRRLGVPVVMTARGSDVNVKCKNPIMRAWIRWAARNCAALVTVSQALMTKLGEAGVHAPIQQVLRNGADLEKFRLLDRAECRARLGVSGHVVASVGHLVKEKGHDLAIEAVAGLPGVTLLVVGEGPELDSLRRAAHARGMDSRVKFLGLVDHDQMPLVYNAADALVLPSVREGMPNVILESLACGTRVVATAVGGVGELVTSPDAGALIQERSARSLRDALAGLLESPLPVERTRRFGERFGWDTVVDQQVSLYRAVLEQGIAPSRARVATQ